MGAFGEFISKKRQDLGMTLRGFAKELGKSPSYVSDIEKGNREPNEKALLESLVKVLKLSNDEANKLYDMAAAQKNELAQDVSEYVNETALAKVALRTAKENGATEEDWKKFIEKLKEKK
ncbi:helix-turn-helix transcriptional regulator [uncultured Treponema sp.]|uniref:helix-turn-helix domain-containing protein n=1 Tax=uncultured Treponema sp. TaxID=162155 RepID=UPI00258B2107|nr:helix-turn-helix transcriptional regulator [uncultured Treponema sp.]